jgi:hypothetical protein
MYVAVNQLERLGGSCVGNWEGIFFFFLINNLDSALALAIGVTRLDKYM